MSADRRRTKYDIYADTIEVIAKKGLCSLTRVSYGANMPVDRAKKVLDLLVSHGFVREVTTGDHRKYRATKWGLEYLETFKRMRRFFAALEQPVKIEIPEVVLPGRIATGYEDLDGILFGGIPKDYAVILTSPSCDEKELLIKRFLETGTKSGQVTFHLTTESGNTKSLAEEFPKHFYLFICNPQAGRMIENRSNAFKLKGVENLTDISIALTSSFRKFSASSESPKRACLEFVSDILLQHQAVQTRRWLSGLIPELKSKGFTTLAVMNPYMHPPQDVHAILSLFEGEISIFEKETKRGMEKFLKVKKMYNQRYLEDRLPIRKHKLKR